MINFRYFFQSFNHGILGQYFRNMKEIFMAKKGALTGLVPNNPNFKYIVMPMRI